MSFENYPSTENTAKPGNTWETKKRDYIIALLVIILLGTWAYIIWDKGETKETVQQKDLLISNTSSQRDQLKKELEEATMLYDQIKTHSANMVQSKDSTIFRRDREIREKQNKIQQLLSKVGATRVELAHAKALITSLQQDIQGYRTQVETLQAEKRVLTEEKRSVTRQRDNFQRYYDSANNIIKEKEDVIDIASTLHASNFSILGINEKTDGKEKITTVAKRVDKLRISFDIDENRIAQSGEKKLYVCITDPDGKPLAVEALGSGKFNTRDGIQKYFTQKIDINYTQGKRQTLSLDWKQNSSFATGEYKIEVYNNGFKIGEGIRILKKGGLFS